MSYLRSLCVCLVTVLLTGCLGSGQGDLDAYIEGVKNRPPTPIEPIPEIKTPEVYLYISGAEGLRTPFIFVDKPAEEYVDNGIRPDANRPREELEQYSLDTLRMVGTLDLVDATYGLIKNKEGTVYRVRQGNYMGRNHGRITGVFTDRIELMEIVGDRAGGYVERQTTVALGVK